MEKGGARMRMKLRTRVLAAALAVLALPALAITSANAAFTIEFDNEIEHATADLRHAERDANFVLVCLIVAITLRGCG